MLRLGRERERLSIVDDQIGGPTTSIALADATRLIVDGVARGQYGSPTDWAGLYHMTCAGSTTWYGFASEIFARAQGLPDGHKPELNPIASADYPTPAKRPRNSVLANEKLHARFAVQLSGWEAALDATMLELRRANLAS